LIVLFYAEVFAVLTEFVALLADDEGDVSDKE